MLHLPNELRALIGTHLGEFDLLTWSAVSWQCRGDALAWRGPPPARISIQIYRQLGPDSPVFKWHEAMSASSDYDIEDLRQTLDEEFLLSDWESVRGEDYLGNESYPVHSWLSDLEYEILSSTMEPFPIVGETLGDMLERAPGDSIYIYIRGPPHASLMLRDPEAFANIWLEFTAPRKDFRRKRPRITADELRARAQATLAHGGIVFDPNDAFEDRDQEARIMAGRAAMARAAPQH